MRPGEWKPGKETGSALLIVARSSYLTTWSSTSRDAGFNPSTIWHTWKKGTALSNIWQDPSQGVHEQTFVHNSPQSPMTPEEILWRERLVVIVCKTQSSCFTCASNLGKSCETLCWDAHSLYSAKSILPSCNGDCDKHWLWRFIGALAGWWSTNSCHLFIFVKETKI